MHKITIEDVAKKSGVSKGTVSAVINAKNSVTPSTRDRVLDVMKEMNFRPKGVARDLKRGNQDKSIGIIIKDIENPFYTSIAAAASELAASRGYSFLISSSNSEHEWEKTYSRLYCAKDIKGVIIAPSVAGSAEIEHLFNLKMLNYPFVLLEEVKGIQANVVAIDNIGAVKKAVKYLIDGGHTRIIHFAGPEHYAHTQERIEGFRYAFSESPLIFTKECVEYIGADYDGSFAKATEYFSGKQREEYPTAIVCFNDRQALAVMMALQALGIRVPGDVSIVGNDDIFYAGIYPVPLTTIRAPRGEIGRAAAGILIRNIESPGAFQVERVVFETEFIVRQSTRPLTT